MAVRSISGTAMQDLLAQLGLLSNGKTQVESFGYFLQNYVVQGAEIEINSRNGKRIDLTEGVISFNGVLYTTAEDSFGVNGRNQTFFLDFTSNGVLLNVVHPGDDYLPLWQINTGSDGIIESLVDLRGEVGKMRLNTTIADIPLIQDQLAQEIETKLVEVNSKIDTSAEEIEAARGIKPTLFEQLEYLEKESFISGTRISQGTLSAKSFKTAHDADKIQPEHFSAASLAMMNGQSPTGVTPAPGSVVNDSVANGAITQEKTTIGVSFEKVTAGVQSLFSTRSLAGTTILSTPSDITMTINSSNELTAKAVSTARFPIMLPEYVSDVTFEKVAGSDYVALGGNNSLWTSVGLADASPAGKVVDFTPTGLTVRSNQFQPGLVGAASGDVINIKATPTQYVFTIKRVGESAFSAWFTLAKAVVPSATGWANNSRLGFTFFSEEVQGAITVAQRKAKDITFEHTKIDDYNASIAAKANQSDLLSSTSNLQTQVNAVTQRFFVENVQLAALANFEGTGATLSLDSSNFLYVLLPTGGVNNAPVFLPSPAYQIEFEFGGPGYVALGGTSSNYTGICITQATMTRVADFTGSAITVRNTQLLTGLTGANTGDIIRVKYENGTYTFKIQRTGTTGFVAWFTVSKSQVPSATGWNANQRLGFVRFKEESALGTNQKFHRNISFISSTEELVLPELNDNVNSLKLAVQALQNAPIFGPWEDEEGVCGGDSITAGVGNSSPTDPSQLYHALLKPMLGLSSMTAYGVSGSHLSGAYEDPSGNSGNPAQSFTARFNNMSSTAKLIIVFISTNDYGHEKTAPWGSFADRTDISYYGALHYVMNGLLNKYPTGQVVFVTPLHREGDTNPNPVTGKRLVDYVNAIKEVAEYYAIPVLDLYRESGIQPNIPINKTTYAGDGLHPNAAGHALIARKLAGFVNQL